MRLIGIGFPESESAVVLVKKVVDLNSSGHALEMKMSARVKENRSVVYGMTVFGEASGVSKIRECASQFDCEVTT